MPKTKEDNSPDVVKAKCDRLWSDASDNRKSFDWKWFTYDLMVSGEHYSKWNKELQQVVTPKTTDNRPRIVVNKIYTTLRAVRNYAVRNRPKPEVTPYDLTPDGIDDAIKSNKYLDFLHDKLYLRRKLKETVWHSLKYSDGFWQVLWDEDSEDGKGEIAVNVVDPYDLYWDPIARTPEEARYCILAIRKSIDLLKEDPKYDQAKVAVIKEDSQLAASTLKAKLMQSEKGNSFSTGKETGTVIVKEFWLKEKQKDGKTLIRIRTMAGEQIIRDELTELNRLPFFRLPSDIEPLSMYGQGWVKNMVSPQKLLNKLESQVAEYNDILNRGKWVMDKGAGVRVINNENGQIIEKKRGYDLHQEAISPLSGAIYEQISNANRYIEDMGGAHDASAGRIPTGAHSGRAIEALQVGDSNNMSEIVENIEDFLEQVYEYILYLASKKYQFARNIIPTNTAGEREFLKVIGEDAAKRTGGTPEGATVIHEKNMVDVKVTSWLANTAEARRDVLKELYQLQVIDQQTLLEGYQIGSVADIIKRTKEQQTEQAQAEAAAQEQEATTNAAAEVATAQATQPPQPEAAGPREAIANIRQLLTGQQVTLPMNVGKDYINYLDAFIEGPEAQQLDQQMLQQLIAFRDQLVANPNAMQWQPSPEQMNGPMYQDMPKMPIKTKK